MKSFYLTDTGKVRDHNEDSLIVLENAKHEYLLAVADGMGGHSAGEVASSIAITHLSKMFNDNFLNLEKVQAVNWLRDTVIEINDLIFDYADKHPESKGMGTTLVVALVTKEYVQKELDNNELFEVKTTPRLNEKKFGIILLKDSMHSFGTNQLVKLLVEKK